MDTRLALRIGLEKFPHFLEGNCGIREIVFVKKSKQFLEKQPIHILNIKFCVIQKIFTVALLIALFGKDQLHIEIRTRNIPTANRGRGTCAPVFRVLHHSAR